MYDAILFDLDGTLLPMDNDEFTKGYFALLAHAVSPLGYTADTLIPAMWKGVAAMVKNDGSRYNCDAFWGVFSQIYGDKVYEHIPVFDDFYRTDFNKAKTFTAPTALSRKAVDLAHQKAKKVVLATNPLFPKCAIEARLNWAGLKISDFELITTYENFHTCKPNPAYYTEIAETINVNTQNCLMVGNNADEDIIASQKTGMDTFLITDCLICEGDMPDCKKGDYEEFIEFLNKK